ncbi:TrkA family potassium uptake protein [Clostridiaceae bacterium 35-E11]
MKQFAVIGCGRFGSSIAKTLYHLGYDVLAIDKDADVIQSLDEFVTHAVQVDATDGVSMRPLGIRNFDVVIVAVGSNIQSSILIALLAKELGVKHVVAKAQNELHANVLYKIGVDRVIFAERDMGVRVAHNLVSSNILEYIELSPDYSIVEIAVLKEWEGRSLKDLDMREKYGINIMAIKHGSTINIAPDAFDVITHDDILVAIAHHDDLWKIEKIS